MVFDNIPILMRAEVRDILSNDIRDWPNWQPAAVEDELQWFTVSVGVAGEPGADDFQVAVATPRAITATAGRRAGRYVGLVVDAFTPAAVEAAIRRFVESFDEPTWPRIAERLDRTMIWEYRGYR